MNNKKTLSVLILLLLFSSGALGVNLKALEYSPVRYFTDEDWVLARSTAREALTEGENGKSYRWDNERSGSYGSLSPISDEMVDGRRCRDLVIRNFAGGVNGGGTYRFCQMEDGSWKVLGGKLGR
jgi:surface antigen